jgi:DNA-binding MarR family transcriptional regulator
MASRTTEHPSKKSSSASSRSRGRPSSPSSSKSPARSTSPQSASRKPSAATGQPSSASPRTRSRTAARLVRDAHRTRVSNPLHVDPAAPAVDGEALVRAEQCIALLQRRLIKPMSRGGPRGDLTLTQYHALSFLAARGQASVSELKEILGVAQSTTSVLVDKLARMGLVEKHRDGRDARLACVVPLPKGLRMVQRYRKNGERNLLALAAVLGTEAVRDVFVALERALIATAPLEDPRICRVAADDPSGDVDGDENDDFDIDALHDPDETALKAAE